MDYYVRQGERTLGPLLLFQLRQKLEDGDIVPTDLCWHDGMDAWARVSEIESLRDAMPAPEAGPEMPPPLPPLILQARQITEEEANRLMEVSRRSALAWRRFFARWLDLTYLNLVVLSVVVAGEWFRTVEFGNLQLLVELSVAFFWMLLEALLVWRFGATPAKALLGLRVTDPGGQRLSLRQSLRRSFDVWLFGCACQIPFLALVPKLLAFQRFRFLGVTTWDHSTGAMVSAKALSPAGVIIAVFLFLGLMCFLAGLLLQHPPPEFQKMLESFRVPISAPAAPSYLDCAILR